MAFGRPGVENGSMIDRRRDLLVATYAADRAATMATIDALDDAGWARTGTHATFGVLDVAGLMIRAVDHDEEHIKSFER